jgi:hypothetical protein
MTYERYKPIFTQRHVFEDHRNIMHDAETLNNPLFFSWGIANQNVVHLYNRKYVKESRKISLKKYFKALLLSMTKSIFLKQCI